MLNFIPFRLAQRTNLLTSIVLVNVTIGIGDFIHSEKAAPREVFAGSISVFISITPFLRSEDTAFSRNQLPDWLCNRYKYLAQFLLPMVLKNDGQPSEKPWAMFYIFMGNVFQNYWQCFLKLWAMFYEPMSHIFCKFVRYSEKY